MDDLVNVPTCLAMRMITLNEAALEPRHGHRAALAQVGTTASVASALRSLPTLLMWAEMGLRQEEILSSISSLREEAHPTGEFRDQQVRIVGTARQRRQDRARYSERHLLHDYSRP